MKNKISRRYDQLRSITIKPNFLKFALASVLISQGNTKVICTASMEDRVPPHLKNSGTGWVTAEYAMLPAATNTRSSRKKMIGSGRTMEIQRLIGRSLRSVVNLADLGERTISIDCDVIQADGGTRTASITGAYVALRMALKKLHKDKIISNLPLKNYVAAVSVGIVDGKPTLDLCYEQDVAAAVDMNVVMTDDGKFVEVQGTGEEATYSEKELYALLDLAKKGIKEIIKIQKKVVK